MPITRDDLLPYYATHSAVTDPGIHAPLFDGLPEAIPALCQTVRGLLLDLWDAPRYGVALTEERKEADTLRGVGDMLARIVALDPAPLMDTRPPDARLGANSRQFALLLCAILRQRRIPARLRYGFAPYFGPELNYAHCLCEYWAADTGRWVAVDAQLDALQRVVYHIAFDPADMPSTAFIGAAQAWHLCQSGQADPEHFGLTPSSKTSGMPYVRSQLIRDCAALNKVETLLWDIWGVMEKAGRDLTDADTALLERVAELTQAATTDFGALRALYDADERLRVPTDRPLGWPPANRLIGRGPAHPVKPPTPATHRPKRREFLKK